MKLTTHAMSRSTELMPCNLIAVDKSRRLWYKENGYIGGFLQLPVRLDIAP